MSSGSGLERSLPKSELERAQFQSELGYAPDEKLRLQQLRELRRRWLKDQELSPREPVLPPRKLGLVEGFWVRFLQPGGFWRNQVYKAYNTAKIALIYVPFVVLVTHYCLKEHLMKKPYALLQEKPPIFPGDIILETGEVIPPLEIPSSHEES